ncbi:MAG: GNAT family N-acetyltransferase [Acidobacteriota bacterium]|nr:GNAT family N-acetyltransferase [Acidobacteriota bacterium]
MSPITGNRNPDQGGSVEFATWASLRPEHHAVWRELHLTHDGHQFVYTGPVFFETLVETEPADNLRLAVRRAPSIFAALRMRRKLLDPHGMAGLLLRWRIRMWTVLGSEPLFAPGAADSACVASFLCDMAAVPGRYDALELQSVEVGSVAWDAVTASRDLKEKFLVYMPNGVRLCHTTQLPDSHDAYLAQFPRKKRYNLARQLRQIAEKLGGEAHVVPLDTAEAIPELTEAIRSLGQEGSASLLQQKEYVALARRGLFLNFIVRAGSHTVAVILGIPSGATYYLHKIMYSHRLVQYSPGTSAMHLMNEWFIADGRFKRLDFGFGDPERKFSSTNTTVERARILLLRRTWPNHALVVAHRTVVSAERLARKGLRALRAPRPLVEAMRGRLKRLSAQAAAHT